MRKGEKGGQRGRKEGHKELHPTCVVVFITEKSRSRGKR
jgi:hypothetical protein